MILRSFVPDHLQIIFLARMGFQVGHLTKAENTQVWASYSQPRSEEGTFQ